MKIYFFKNINHFYSKKSEVKKLKNLYGYKMNSMHFSLKIYSKLSVRDMPNNVGPILTLYNYCLTHPLCQ